MYWTAYGLLTGYGENVEQQMLNLKFMDAQAQEDDGHLNELAELVDQGEEVELIRPGKPSLKIMIDKPVVTTHV